MFHFLPSCLKFVVSITRLFLHASYNCLIDTVILVEKDFYQSILNKLIQFRYFICKRQTKVPLNTPVRNSTCTDSYRVGTLGVIFSSLLNFSQRFQFYIIFKDSSYHFTWEETFLARLATKKPCSSIHFHRVPLARISNQSWSSSVSSRSKFIRWT